MVSKSAEQINNKNMFKILRNRLNFGIILKQKYHSIAEAVLEIII